MKNNLSRTNKKQIELARVVLDYNNEAYLVAQISDEEYCLINTRTGEREGIMFSSLKDLQKGLVDSNDIVYGKNEVMIMNVGE